MKRKMGLFLLIFMLLPLNVKADEFSVDMSCSSSASAGEKVKCIVSLDPSDKVLNSVSGNYNIPNGVTFDSFVASAGLTNLGNESGFKFEGEFSSSTTLGTLMVTLPGDAVSNTEYTVSLTGINGHDTAAPYTSSDASSTIRIKSTENRLSSLSISGGTIDFNSDILNYVVTIDSDSAVISASKIDPNSNIDGNIGTVALNYGENTFNINVTSELGEIKTYTINVTRPDNRSKNNNLATLVATNTDLSFDKEKTTYELTTTAADTLISATKEDNKSSMMGQLGKFDLAYGLNTFKINVVAENGDTKIYTLNITRKDDRSDNNYLKSLSISKGSLKFKKDTITYNVEVENDVEKVNVSATLDHGKASFVEGFGPREVALNLGNNTIYVKVQNERGELRTYTININRNDGRDTDSTLKEIKLSEGNIDFKADVLEYKVNVKYEVEKFEIKATANSEKSKVTIEGDKNLVVGENVFTITVEAENGKQTIYKITVVRKENGYKLSSNNYIKSITIKNHGLDFSSNVYRYTIKTKEDKLDLSIVLEDKKSEYEITGNKNLEDGSKITIKVTAENGDIRTYILDIEKSSNLIIIIIIILVTLITAGIITIILLKRKKRQKIQHQTIIEDSEKISNSVEKKEKTDEVSDTIVFTDEDFTEFQ